ncbi:type II 3-dehydroquinate dehydratase [Fusobacterium perfoetens]|uniref:type II 3-dehydroquinate dehydratase n=1 Tax=Fusobacterium perfoetens TaxID=852 RepID=UPI001F234878|nr:type II 3-dehydroquinate dehydratase [Fusobacterium perfoetens]MCF2612754.1 type II 3-dehydroquinate dehydratase [Fusobacterium perfoetens]
MRILVINGPNINMLGIREKNIYGVNDYNSLVEKIKKEASELDCQVDFFQSNIEGEIITSIQKAFGVYDGIIINPAAYTHYSIGILDALKSVNIPAIEIHISNIYQREDFRKKSVTAEGCIGQISGLGFEGYTLALRGLVNLLK